MKRHVLAVGAIALATALGAGPAVADSAVPVPQQSTAQSPASVQASDTTVAPSASAQAPVEANAPVCVDSTCGGGSAAQDAGTTSSGTSGQGSSQPQSADQSPGSAQAGGTTVAPRVAAQAPVQASAPVCGDSTCSASSASQDAG